ncbi:hypothetical protein CC78DRAFT_379161 [Lojkania enalia]|uniref:Double-strand-break repair protein rad21 n=1 Tax=Lojkania enalia TaxID=147567 RepID=A0A9P4N776_9PLEO|nr:hypothetical protein CC78DRAFT_379161 [Didymosphaeria enalia]
MFYPPHLLSMSGPLARVWLAANIEKKLSKPQVLQDKIVDDIKVITRPEVAGGPMALRLSGQLLLGVVRIYSRKARYLLDDCNEALARIRTAFRPGNVDLSANQSHIANPASLTLPDAITEIDLLQPMPDVSLVLAQQDLNLGGLEDTTVLDWDNSQFLSGSIEQPRQGPTPLDDDYLPIDVGADYPPGGVEEGMSIEIGRNAPLGRRASEEIASSPKLLEEDPFDFGDDIPDTSHYAAPAEEVGVDVDITMGGMTDIVVPAEPEPEGDESVPEHRKRESLSPLSSIRSSIERDLEQTFQQEQETTAFEEEESVHHAQRAKRRKVLHADADTEIQTAQIREQQNDRSKILKPASFLPRDPMLLALMNMQKSGGFVSSILGDGRSRGWAPELRGILSLEVVERPGQKRKRDSGVADLDIEEEAASGAEKTPQLEFEEEQPELEHIVENIGGDTTGFGQDDEIIQLPEAEGIVPLELEEEEGFSPVPDNFDDTTAPLLHPAESGPISLGTKHAVHLLRERFGAEAEHSESQRQRTSVLFQDMLPEATTTKADATKMFFEVLVLATKDAIKVEQPVDQLGGPLRIRGKRGLWGEWAEASAGGELETQPEPTSPAAPAAAPGVTIEA